MKYYIEVGSTVTKVDSYDGENLERIKDITILFKKHYGEKKELDYSDVDKLVDFLNELNLPNDTYIYGTSIFRKLTEEEFNKFYEYLNNKTGLDFKVISQEEEGRLTVIGAAHKANKKVCVMIGGGGSTEVSIYDKGIIESCNSNIGVIDVLKNFPDLGEDVATTSVEEVMDYVRKNMNLPKEKADILILAGGAHEKFARLSGITFEDNTLYEDVFAPIMMDIDTRIKDTHRYFEEISLDDIRAKSDDPSWWDATRAMCVFALVLAEEIGAKYVVPTDIAIAHGIIASNN